MREISIHKNSTIAKQSNGDVVEKRVQVRLSMIITLDSDKFAADDKPALDTDKLIAGMIAAGMTESEAKTYAAQTIAKRNNSESVTALRESVRKYVISNVENLAQLSDANATVLNYNDAEQRKEIAAERESLKLRKISA